MTRQLLAEGQPLALGLELGRGGEGVIHEVPHRHGLVAKVYHAADDERASRIEAMLALRTPALTQIAAWPEIAVYESGGVLAGFLMRYASHQQDVHRLYSPRSRQLRFPHADFGFLVEVAINVARAFAIVHEHGHVIGDVNHSNLLVGPGGDVTLIDCDSFQISADRLYPCKVGVAAYSPPELLKLGDLAAVTRTRDHDNFGLAILIFQLLYLGRHPFAGRFLGEGEMPLERAIQEGRFPYGRDAQGSLMRPPPGTMPLPWLSEPIAEHFEQAFTGPGPRPRPRQWMEALAELKSSLVPCPNVAAHVFPPAVPGGCPWCHVEHSLGLLLFGGSGPGVGFDIARFWREVRAIEDPGPPPPLPPRRRPRPSPQAMATLATRRKRRTLACLQALLCMGGAAFVPLVQTHVELLLGVVMLALGVAAWLWNLGEAELRERMTRRLHEARAEWRALQHRWKTETSGEAFEATLGRLRAARNAYAQLTGRGLRAAQRGEFHESRQLLEQRMLEMAQELKTARELALQARHDLTPRLLEARTEYLKAQRDWDAIR
ncbi:MAG: hypothetical protein ACYCW6_30720 [Candidatus Xenobia bacterium]